jgi:hypothetical protein
MESLYFLFFCVLIAYIIFWALRNDDLEKFKSDEPMDDAGDDGDDKNAAG